MYRTHRLFTYLLLLVSSFVIIICILDYDSFHYVIFLQRDVKLLCILLASVFVFVISSLFLRIISLKTKILEVYHELEIKLSVYHNECLRKIKEIQKEYDNKLSFQIEINRGLDKLLKSKTPFRHVAEMVADYETSIYKKEEYYLMHKPRPAIKSAEKVKEIRSVLYENVAVCKQMMYKYEFLLNIFPELKEYVDDEISLLCLAHYSSKKTFDEERDRVRDWLTDDEYKKLSTAKRNQLALDRYKYREKNNWEIGIDYELFIGYLLREGLAPFNAKYHVIQYGELYGIEDLGRDIIAEKANLDGSRTIYIIQCKRWREDKLIHENVICQLFGTTIEYQIEHCNYKNCKFVPLFISTAELSSKAQEFAKILKVEYLKIPIGDYPMVKCNINGVQKIYHLPFDQQYYRTEIKNAGEFYAFTVEEAERKGFRRALKHFI